MAEAISSHLRHEQAAPPSAFLSQPSFHFVWLFRSLVLCLALAAVSSIHPLGTNPWGLSVSVLLGTFLGSVQAFRKTYFARSLGYLLLGYLLIQLLSYGGSLLVPADREAISLFYATSLHLHANYTAFAFGFALGMLFWRSYHFVTLECLLIASSAVYFLSGHRNLNFAEAPRLVTDLAWRFGLDNFSMLVLFGTSLTLLLTFYLFAATVPGRPRVDREGVHISHFSNHAPRYILGSLVVVALFALMAIVSQQVYRAYYEAVLSQTANGVAQFESSEEAIGKSPLGFHSALGTNNQPSALVRLDGDYRENPFSPMLYLREGALSQLEGNELVSAGKLYDDDLTYTGPNEKFRGQEDLSLFERVPVAHSVYLLSQHDTAFAVDYPLSITQLENPAPERFAGAYRAYSVAPAFALDSLRLRNTGDPRWEEEKQAHYKDLHPDPRYAELAQEITRGIADPAEQAFAITEWLSAKAIYTLTPNHEVEPGSDPVAPFLFGDMRGYCVHFAHATTYMLRALGISARIATGYLTDLSQSKDGHILLRMSDRHAWAEAYFEGKGWIPFDTQPDQVENHANSDVDFSLLEELMGLVGPDKELFPENLLEGETMVKQASPLSPQLAKYFSLLLALIVSLLLAIKIYLRYSWLLPSSPQVQIARLHRSLLSQIGDAGVWRSFSETMQEFSHRIPQELSTRELSLSQLYTTSKYSPQVPRELVERAKAAFQQDSDSLREIGFFKRYLAFLNPSSVYRFFSGGLS